MMWKKFIVSLLCIIYSTLAHTCGYIESAGGKNTYMFKTYDYKQTYWWNDNDSRKNNIAFWYNYTQGNVDSASIDKALYECSVADIDNGTNGFFIYLHNTNDADALRYWTINKTFSSKIDNPWYYPNRA